MREGEKLVSNMKELIFHGSEAGLFYSNSVKDAKNRANGWP